jgi:hypothetical protein
MGLRFTGIGRYEVQCHNLQESAFLLSIPGGHAASKFSNAGKPVTLFNLNSCRTAEKGRRTMRTSLQSASTSLPALTGAFAKPRRRGDLAYQAMTIVAMLVLLCSRWVF